MAPSKIFTSVEAKLGSTVTQNQILVNFRNTVASDPSGLVFFATMEQQAIRRGSRAFFSEEEQLHGAKVLTRLIALDS